MNGVRRHHGVQVNRVRVIHTAANLARADHTVVNQARVGGPRLLLRVSKSLCNIDTQFFLVTVSLLTSYATLYFTLILHTDWYSSSSGKSGKSGSTSSSGKSGKSGGKSIFVFMIPFKVYPISMFNSSNKISHLSRTLLSLH